MSLDRFRVGDSRKWKVLARNLSHILEYLASFANGDGTFRRNGVNYSPSQESMMRKFGLSDTWIETLLRLLRGLGYLSWTRENKHDRCQYAINMAAVSDANYSDDSDPNYSEKKAVLTPTIQNPDPNYSEKKPSLTPIIRREYLAYPSLPSKEPREREPSADENLSRARFSEKAPRIVNQDDVDAIGAEFCRLMDEHGTKHKNPKDGVSSGYSKPVSRDDIETMLRRCSREEVLTALKDTFTGAADDQAIKYIEKNFFAKQGGVALVIRQRQKGWLEEIQAYIDAVDLDDLPAMDLDKFVNDRPIPVGLETEGCKLLNAARKNWNRLAAAKYPACEGCWKRGDVLVDGACEDCRLENTDSKSCRAAKSTGCGT
jgi:hypothetical protein